MSAHWTRPVDGAGTWRHTPAHRPVVVDIAVTFLASVLGLVLFVGLVVVARHGVCRMYEHRTDAPSYCTQEPQQ